VPEILINIAREKATQPSVTLPAAGGKRRRRPGPLLIEINAMHG